MTDVPSAIVYRRANPDDAAAIALVHVVSWRETYPGLLPQRVIDARNIAGRTELWDSALRSRTGVTIVAEVDGVVCGCANIKVTPDEAFDAYLQTLYVVAAAQKMGIGRGLLTRLARTMLEREERSLSLHVLASTPARGFYERMGAHYVADVTVVDEADSWLQCVYAWDDVSSMTTGFAE